MTSLSTLEHARESFARRSWAEACDRFPAADREAPLEPSDLQSWAIAADLAGRSSGDIWTRAHHAFVERGDRVRAARCAFGLGFGLMNRGERAPAAGWFARARRMLDDDGRDCAERGYLLIPDALRAIFAGDNAGALALFEEADAIGARFGDPDLIAVARQGRGRALIRLGRIAEGMALLDEVMVGVTTGEVSPYLAGDIYCSVIEACHEVFDLRRAQEWTAALSHWIELQPEIVPYRGQCLIRRAEIMQLHGAWPDALEESQRACAELTRPPPQAAAGAAYYQQAELHRLRGAFAEAEEGYRRASECGKRPEPGLALLRLAQGQVAVAVAAIRRALDEARDRLARSRLLAAHVEVMLAADDPKAARAAADELGSIATALDVPLLRAIAADADGATRLAEGDARAALDALRRAWAEWQEIGAPYEAARTRVLIGIACRALEDVDTADMELAAARRAFEQLGAVPALARIDAHAQHTPVSPTGGLTSREIQVLRHVATGRTNRAIAADLFISEKTVARHVSNIFMKLGLPSRAAATAYAYEHHLV